jgi:hypothetical protein
VTFVGIPIVEDGRLPDGVAPLVSDWKPTARIVDDGAGREKLRREGACRICGRRPSGHPLDSLNRMHVVPRSQGGDDVDDNIVPGCGSGSTGCHGLLTSRREDPSHPAGLSVAEALDEMNRSLTVAERRYAEEKKWTGWIERAYPRIEEETDG